MLSPMNTICPHCQMRVAYNARQAGKPVTCPVCHAQFPMPTPNEQAKLIEEVGVLKREQMERFRRARESRSSLPEEGSRYPALRFVAGLLQFLAVAVLFLSSVGLVAVGITEMPGEQKIQFAVFLSASILLGPAVLWGMGELILLLVDMANDMRATRHEITRLRRRRG